MDGPVLSVRDLCVSFKLFGGEAVVLNNIDLTAMEREVVALVGETGCGKSITVKSIMGVLPTPPARIVKGEVLFRGKDLLSISKSEQERLRREIAIVPQSVMTSLNPTFTVGEQLVDVIALRDEQNPSLFKSLRLSKEEKKEAKRIAIKILEDVLIPSPERVLENYPFQLSGGMRQRILIATALVKDPSLLLLDEPGTALDVTTYDRILTLIEDKIKERKLSAIYVTHNLAVAKRISNRIYIMYAGNIVEAAPSGRLFTEPKHPYTIGLVNAIPKLTTGTFEGIRGRIPDYMSPPSGCRFHPRCDHVMGICSKERPVLTEVGDAHAVACHLFSQEGVRES